MSHIFTPVGISNRAEDRVYTVQFSTLKKLKTSMTVFERKQNTKQKQFNNSCVLLSLSNTQWWASLQAFVKPL
jgi:hypothetical protein